MDTLNHNPQEAAPAVVPAPAASAPEAAAAPAVAATPAAAPAPAAKPAPAASVPGVKMEIPKTTGTTVGGWNRFAGYNPHDAKNKQKDGRGGGSKGRR